MTFKDQEFAKKITTYLDEGTAGLKLGTANRLQLARQEALSRLGAPRRAPELQLSGAYSGGASGNLSGGHRSLLTSGRLWFGIVFVVVTAFGYQQWQAYSQLNDIEETDAAILASDLPIDAYLDRGFQNRLKHASDD